MNTALAAAATGAVHSVEAAPPGACDADCQAGVALAGGAPADAAPAKAVPARAARAGTAPAEAAPSGAAPSGATPAGDPTVCKEAAPA